jgi:hypothetical protein
MGLWDSKRAPLPPDADAALTKAVERLKNMTPEEADVLYAQLREAFRKPSKAAKAFTSKGHWCPCACCQKFG